MSAVLLVQGVLGGFEELYDGVDPCETIRHPGFIGAIIETLILGVHEIPPPAPGNVPVPAPELPIGS